MSEPVDLSAVAKDADALDALADGRQPTDPAVALLAALRDRTPAPAVPGPEPVTLPAPRRRAFALTRWRAAVVLAIAAAVPSTGVAAAAAHPGNPLYGIHRAILGPTADDSSVPRRLLDKADDETSAITADVARSARHAAAAWDLVSRARSHLPDLRARDAAQLSNRASHIESRLRASGTRAARVATVPATHATPDRVPRWRHRHHHWASLPVRTAPTANDAARA